ncbi:MAG TPA: pyridoxal phosphate-dependent aminotransferase [Candidatus Thermoplasmatota archaeon]|nr:pyridoxal phosphate-dependent aminotransferase [Candidatus Thermoplasmatota archaeon]
MPARQLVARRLLGVEMSGIRKMFELAGSNSVNMGLGDPDFDPPTHVQKALHEAVAGGKNHYGPSLGLPELREAVAHRIKSYRGEDVSPENIIITAGATQALMSINQTFVDHGDEVLVPDPGFVVYPAQARICGGFPIPYSLKPEHNYAPQIDEIQEKITPRTKLIVINTPGNPTGACMDRDAVRAVVEVAQDKDIMVVADEVYDFLTYDHPHRSFLSHMDNVIWVNSFSKTYAMTGWRLGCIATRREYVKAIEIMHYHTVACPPTPFQVAGVAALEGPQAEPERMLNEFRKRRDHIHKRISRIRGLHMAKPEGAFYAFPHYDFRIPSQELAMDLARKGLICTPGTAFGRLGERHLRFSYACGIETIDRGMDILEKHCESLPLKD